MSQRRSTAPVPQNVSPELRQHLQSIQASLNILGGMIRNTAPKAEQDQALTISRLITEFPRLLAKNTAGVSDSVFETGVYERGVFEAPGDAGEQVAIGTLWLQEPNSVSHPEWIDG